MCKIDRVCCVQRTSAIICARPLYLAGKIKSAGTRYEAGVQTIKESVSEYGAVRMAARLKFLPNLVVLLCEQCVVRPGQAFKLERASSEPRQGSCRVGHKI